MRELISQALDTYIMLKGIKSYKFYGVWSKLDLENMKKGDILQSAIEIDGNIVFSISMGYLTDQELINDHVTSKYFELLESNLINLLADKLVNFSKQIKDGNIELN